MNPENILNGLDKFTGEVKFVFGSKDPSIDCAKKLKRSTKSLLLMRLTTISLATI